MARADRVAELIKQEVSDIITRKLSDPRIGFTSVTGVDIGADLQNATIHVSVMGSDQQKEDTMRALSRAKGYVKGELGHRIQLRDVPDIYFKLDTTIERAAKFFAVLNQVQKMEEKDIEKKIVKTTKKRRPNAKINKRNKKSR
jgi:ribosome-binding factor A